MGFDAETIGVFYHRAATGQPRFFAGVTHALDYGSAEFSG